MKWLLWKDYRHNRLIVFTAVFLLLLPYLIALGVNCWAEIYYPGTSKWKLGFAFAGLYGFLCQKRRVCYLLVKGGIRFSNIMAK